MSVLLNTTPPGATTASFAAQQTFATGSRSNRGDGGGLNGDGKPDLIVANNNGSSVSVFMNTTSFAEASVAGVPTPAFPLAATLPAGIEAVSVQAVDLNADGKPDLVVANVIDGTVSVYMNTTSPAPTTPTFAPEQTVDAFAELTSVSVADVNGDGRPDLVVLDYVPSKISVLLNTTAPGSTTASFPPRRPSETGFHPSSLTVADLNGDGRPDFLVTYSSYYAYTHTHYDYLCVSINTTAPGSTTVSFTPQQTFAPGISPTSTAVADINGDGLPDVIVANSGASYASVFLNTTAPGSTTASFAAEQTISSGFAVSVVAADLNGDGRPDLVFAGQGTGEAYAAVNTTIPGSTTVSFAPVQAFSIGGQPHLVIAADLNGDGRPDLIAGNYDVYSVSVLFNTTPAGSTTLSFAAVQSVADGGTKPNSVVAADLNGDGRPDIVASNLGAPSQDGSLSILMNTPAVLGTNPATGTIESAPVVSSFVLADPSPTTAATVDFTVTFSDAVSGVTAASFVLTGTGTTGASIGTPTTSDGGIIWTIPVTTGALGTWASTSATARASPTSATTIRSMIPRPMMAQPLPRLSGLSTPSATPRRSA